MLRVPLIKKAFTDIRVRRRWSIGKNSEQDNALIREAPKSLPPLRKALLNDDTTKLIVVDKDSDGNIVAVHAWQKDTSHWGEPMLHTNQYKRGLLFDEEL